MLKYSIGWLIIMINVFINKTKSKSELSRGDVRRIRREKGKVLKSTEKPQMLNVDGQEDQTTYQTSRI